MNSTTPSPHIASYPLFTQGKIIFWIIFLGTLFFGLIKLIQYNKPPEIFPVPYHLTIEPGQTLFSISAELRNDGALTSRRLFEMWMLVLGNDRSISEGQFYFKEPTSALQLALRISGRQFGIEKKKVTFPEGFTSREMAKRLKETFPEFDDGLFLQLAAGDEGYLFPDTYSFFPSVQADLVLAALKNNFLRRTESLEKDFKNSPRSKEHIITMASIVEREASGPEDRAVIAGILWKRFDMGKPLEVDAPFVMLLGKESAELTRKDLAIDSPYNTYRRVGLPPTPIANPGLAAIVATLRPESSPYLFYLHDKEGTIHYAKDYKEHLQNIQRYLRNRN